MAVEKVVFAAMRACVAAAVMFPVGIWILGSIPWQAVDRPAVVAMIVLGSLLGAAMGLILGTFVPPNRISVTLTLVLTPLIFTGSSQYPWPSLSHLRWFQVVSAAQPDDLRERGTARPDGAGSPPHPDLDLLCGGGGVPGGAGRGGHGWIPAAVDRVNSVDQGVHGQRVEEGGRPMSETQQAGSALQVDQLRRMAEHFPNEPGYRVLGEGQLTFAEWERDSNRLARGLTSLGVRRGGRVAVQLDGTNGLRWVTTYAAAHKAGAAIVPLDSRLSANEIGRMVAHAKVSLLVADWRPGGQRPRPGREGRIPTRVGHRRGTVADGHRLG